MLRGLEGISERPSLDVSDLKHTAFGVRSLIWWGTFGLIVIEGTMFAIIVASYFYLRTRTTEWPPGVNNPTLWPGTVNLLIFLASAVPNQWLKKSAEKLDLRAVRIGLLIVSLVAVLNLVIRVFEFPALQCMWDTNAYGSVVWTLLGLHTIHLLTDGFDTWVLTVLMFSGPIQRKRFVDVSENADYWWFVVLTWVPIYLVIYWAPRWL